jgi:putative salt-induced outer membrane protein YdiY
MLRALSSPLGMLAAAWLNIALMMAHPSGADEGVAPQPRWSGSWEPSAPKPGGWDWVRLDSGEWVKGELLLMRDFDLQFDSDEFDVVDLDWEDVAEIITERPYTLVLQDLETTHTGTIAMREGRIAINEAGEIHTFDRNQILAIIPSNQRELNLWSARASAGFSYRSGNTDQSDITGRMKLGREGRNTRLGIEYNGAYGSLNDEKNTNNHRGRSNLDYFLTRDLFLTPAAFEVFSDEFQNVSYRLTPAAGFGYYLVRRPALEWQARLWGGYQHTRFDSAFPGDSKTADNGAIIFSTVLDSDLNSRVDLILEYQVQVIAPDTDQTNHHTAATLEIELFSPIDLDLNFVWDRIEDPETEASGKTPDSNDFRVSVGLAIEY